MHVETSRLILRRPFLKDVPRLFAFLGDAEAMRFTQVVAGVPPSYCGSRAAAPV
jgi:RimJ/RimL family protein N-acetyltransferase